VAAANLTPAFCKPRRKSAEDQTLRLDTTLILCPLYPPPRDVGTVGFASHHAFLRNDDAGCRLYGLERKAENLRADADCL
jgi:hypothetical protein